MDSETNRHPHLATNLESPWTIALLTLVVAGLYLLLHPYLGITHDARLYSLQALSHLRPDLYGNDLFLRYGSQDDYTIFTPLYALVISWMGVEPAAALLTLFSQLAFVAAAGLLARRLMPTRLALSALALLLLLPNHYGSQRIFCYLEGFVTPRLLAESLVLLGVATWLGKRYLLSAAWLVCAMLTHPIMGLSGVALVATMSLAPYWRRHWPLAVLALLAAAMLALVGIIPAHWRFDDEWLGIILERAEYLSLGNWTIDDWGRVATVAATLTIAGWCLPCDLRRLSIAVLFSTSTLMLLALIGGDLLRISIVVQAQPWRALWLATVIAILLLPPIFVRCWQHTPLRRCATLLIAAAWLSPSENVALLIAPLAVTAALSSNMCIAGRTLRLLMLSSYTLLVMMLIDALAVSLLSWRAGTYNITVSPVLDALRGASTGGALPLILLLGGYWAAIKLGVRSALPVATGVLALLVAATAAPTVKTWLDIRYDRELKAAFAEWRSRIPPGSDVMWAADASTAADGAISTWLILERPNYVSRIQATTSLFSRQAALEVRQRTRSILGLLPDIDSLYSKSARTPLPEPLALAPVCRSSSVRYIVTSATFIDATPIHAPAQIRNPFRNLKLYICP